MVEITEMQIYAGKCKCGKALDMRIQMAYMLLSSPKTYDDVLRDFYDIFKALSK